MATMDEIARALGLSKGTVSKALSGAEDVSETTRKLVLEKAVELGYARMVRSGAPKLAVLITNMAYERPEDFGYDVIIGLRKAAQPAGFDVEVIPLTAQIQAQYRYDEFMLLRGCRGALVLGLSLRDAWLRDFETCRTPAVLYDNHVSGNPNVTHIGVDNDEGMRMAVAHLRALGHARIGYLSACRGSYVYQQRYRAFFRALRELGLDARHTLAGRAEHTSECLQSHLPRLLAQGCTAVVCSHDMLAHSVLIHCAERGVAVPGALSIVGFDDIPLCRYTVPPLTTVRQNRAELGKSAFYALSCQLGGVPISTLLLHAELIVRGSCGPAPIPTEKEVTP